MHRWILIRMNANVSVYVHVDMLLATVHLEVQGRYV